MTRPTLTVIAAWVVLAVICVPMSLRSLRVLAPVAVAGFVVLALVVVGAQSPSRAIARGHTDQALLHRCVKALVGFDRASARPDPGSADPQVVAQLAVFRRPRSSADALPAAAHLGAALAGAGATAYDPSAAVRLAREGAHGAVYAVPATIALVTLPAGCNGLRQLAGDGAYLALQALQTGSGPGACLISTQLQTTGSSGSGLPGAPSPKPTRTLVVTQAVCESDAVLSGYIGALGDALRSFGIQLALIPDGISAISYTLADGRRFTASVAGNLVTPPAALSIPPLRHQPTSAQLGRVLAAHLPTAVTESGPDGTPVASLTRPVSLVPDYVGDFSFLRRLLTSSSSTSSSSSGSTGVSCSARTHRCVAVIVTTTCDSHDRCQMSRTIRRYRYVGAKPPAGTTGPNTQATAPIVARINRTFTHPAKLTLVLGGPPQRQVVVLLSVNCIARNSSTGGGGPTLSVAVPSRTPVALPGRARTFRVCNVSALVTSTHRGPVHATVARG